jgi:hypothetical protein
MEKKITEEQIGAILQVVYSTNIPVAQFDALRKLLQELPPVNVQEEPKKK